MGDIRLNPGNPIRIALSDGDDASSQGPNPLPPAVAPSQMTKISRGGSGGLRRRLIFTDIPPGQLPTPLPACDRSSPDCLQRTIQYHLAEIWDILNPDCSLNRCLTSYPIPYQPSDTVDPRFVNVRPAITEAREAYNRLYRLIAQNQTSLTDGMRLACIEVRELLKRLQLQILYMPARESQVRLGFQMLRDIFNTMGNLIEARGSQRAALVQVLTGLTQSVASYRPNPLPPP